ncbi:MAG: hypothetical protein L7F78_16345 [Syntrophales bacterium LBB04]|nr:hypothetical protein [Syntrophales bacterium LBB04]
MKTDPARLKAAVLEVVDSQILDNNLPEGERLMSKEVILDEIDTNPNQDKRILRLARFIVDYGSPTVKDQTEKFLREVIETGQD